MFKGDIITPMRKGQLDAVGEGGYTIGTSKGLLNCFAYAARGQCKASLANSAYKAYNISEEREAVNNCCIKVSKGTVTLHTKPNTVVPPNRELLWAYQASYVYPAMP